MKRSHGRVVGAAAADGELLCKVLKRIERTDGAEPLLILAVAALHLAVIALGIRANELMPDAKLGSGFFKQSWQVAFTIGESALRFYFYFVH